MGAADIAWICQEEENDFIEGLFVAIAKYLNLSGS